MECLLKSARWTARETAYHGLSNITSQCLAQDMFNEGIILTKYVEIIQMHVAKNDMQKREALLANR